MRRKSIEEINADYAAGRDPWEGASIEELSKYYDHYEIQDIQRLRGEYPTLPPEEINAKTVLALIGEFLGGILLIGFIPLIIVSLVWNIHGWTLLGIVFGIAAIPSLAVCIWDFKRPKKIPERRC